MNEGNCGEITSTAITTATATSSAAATTSSVGNEGGISMTNNTNSNIKQRPVKRRRSQQDMHEVATFLAGLKSNSATTTPSNNKRDDDELKSNNGIGTSQLTLSSPGLHAAAYQDAILELQQQL
jgi:hypothetical protein